jgi:uncharacterized protein YeaO (DUF488 family)
VEGDDGSRIWVEPLGLTRDLRQWCSVDSVLPVIGPPRVLWDWFEVNPLAYASFREFYHNHLDRSGLRPALQELAKLAVTGDLTLLHQGSHPARNTATALCNYLVELSASRAPDA